MNKVEFIAHIAAKEGVTKAEAEKMVNAFVNGVTSAVAAGQDVVLMGFGAFVVKDVAERQGFNPLKKEKITLPATKQVRFKVGEGLKKAALGK